MSIEGPKDWMIQEPEDQRKQEQNVKRPLKRKGPSSLLGKRQKTGQPERMDVAAEVAKAKLAAPQPMDVVAEEIAEKQLASTQTAPKKQSFRARVGHAPQAKKVLLAAQSIFHGVAPTLEEVQNKLKEKREAAIILELCKSEDPYCQEIASHLRKKLPLQYFIDWNKRLAKFDPKKITEKDIADCFSSLALSKQVQAFCKLLGESDNVAFQEIARRFEIAYRENEKLLPEKRQHARAVLKTVYNEVKNEAVQDQDIQSADIVATLRKALIYLSFERDKSERDALVGRLGNNNFFAPLQKNKKQEPIAKIRSMYRTQCSLDTLLSELSKKKGGITLGSVERFLHRERVFKHPGDKYTFARLQGLIASSERKELIPLQHRKTHDALIKGLDAARQAGFEEVAALSLGESISRELLLKILTIGPNNQQVETILTKIEPNIAARYHQLERAIQLGFEEETPPARDLLAIALYVEDHITDAEKVDRVFRQQETGLSRTLQLSAKGHLFVIAGEQSLLHGGGSFKKIKSAAGIALENYEETYKGARSYTRVGNMTPSEIAETRQEMKAALELGKEPGFVPCHTFCEYSFRGGKMPRLSMIAEAYEGEVINHIAKLSRDDKIQVAKDIIHGIAFLHQKRQQIHGDLKLDNVLWRREGKRIQAALIDFGFLRDVKEKRPGVFETLDCGKYEDGYYGSISFTAPELYGIPNFTGDPRAVEAFAMGYVLWQLFYGDPPWKEVIEKQYDIEGRAARDSDRDKMGDILEKGIKHEKRKLGKEKFEDCISEEERIKWCLLELLEPNPKARLSVVEAEKKLTEAPPLRQPVKAARPLVRVRRSHKG